MNSTIETIALLIPAPVAVFIAMHQHFSINKLNPIACVEKIIFTLESGFKKSSQEQLVKSYFQAATGSIIDTPLISSIVYSNNPIKLIKKCRSNSSNLKKVNLKIRDRSGSYEFNGRKILFKNYAIFMTLYLAAITVRLECVSSHLVDIASKIMPYILKDDIHLLFFSIVIAASPWIGFNLKRGGFYIDIERAVNENLYYTKNNENKIKNSKNISKVSDAPIKFKTLRNMIKLFFSS